MIDIRVFFRLSIYFLLLLLPFWDVVVPFFTRISSALFYVVGPVRYEIMILFSLFFLIYSIKNKTSFKVLPFVLIFTYISIIVFSLICSNANFILKIEAVKLQLLILIYCFTLFLLSDNKITLDILFIKKILLIQLILVVLVGFLECIDQNILSFLYNKPLDKIQHIHYFSSQRLISLIGNPINLGAFICICICFNLDRLTSKNMSIWGYALLLFSGLIVYMTLSRLSLIAYVFIALMIFYRRNKALFLVSSLFSFLLFLLLSPNLNFNSDSIERMTSVFKLITYENNARVINWGYALEGFRAIYDYLFGLGFGYSNPSREYSQIYGSFVIENTFVSIFVDLGLIGLFLFILIYARFYFLSYKYYKINNDFSFVAFLIVFFIFSIGNDFHRNMPFSFYFWFFYIWLEVKNITLVNSYE